MKRFFALSLVFTSTISIAGTNLSDAIDKNDVPAELEKRENETINRPDAIDRNSVPNTLEERQREEEWRDDYKDQQEDTVKRQNKMRTLSDEY